MLAQAIVRVMLAQIHKSTCCAGHDGTRRKLDQLNLFVSSKERVLKIREDASLLIAAFIFMANRMGVPKYSAFKTRVPWFWPSDSFRKPVLSLSGAALNVWSGEGAIKGNTCTFKSLALVIKLQYVHTNSTQIKIG